MTGFTLLCKSIFGEKANMVIGGILILGTMVIMISGSVEQFRRYKYVENYEIPKKEIKLLLVFCSVIFIVGLILTMI